MHRTVRSPDATHASAWRRVATRVRDADAEQVDAATRAVAWLLLAVYLRRLLFDTSTLSGGPEVPCRAGTRKTNLYFRLDKK
jgi:hypothetical protein